MRYGIQPDEEGKGKRIKMEKSTLFWGLMIAGFLWWLFGTSRAPAESRWYGGWGVVLFIAVVLLGLQVFGQAIK